MSRALHPPPQVAFRRRRCGRLSRKKTTSRHFHPNLIRSNLRPGNRRQEKRHSRNPPRNLLSSSPVLKRLSSPGHPRLQGFRHGNCSSGTRLSLSRFRETLPRANNRRSLRNHPGTFPRGRLPGWILFRRRPYRRIRRRQPRLKHGGIRSGGPGRPFTTRVPCTGEVGTRSHASDGPLR